MRGNAQPRLRFSLRAQLLTGFLGVILLFSFASALAIMQTLENSATIAEISGKTLPDTLDFSEIQTDTLRIQQWIGYSSLTGDPAGNEKAELYYGKAQESLARHLKEMDSELSSELRTKLESLRTQLEDFMSLGTQMVEAYLGSGAEIGNVMMERFNPAADEITLAMESLVSERNEAMKADFDALRSRFRFSLYLFLGAVLVSALLSFGVAMGISGSISKSIGRILAVTKGLSEGDLIGRVKLKSRDELGALAANLNAAIESVKTLVDSVKARATKNEETAKELSLKVGETLEASSRISLGSDGIGKSFSSLVESISQSAESSANIFRSISDLTEEVESQSGAVAETTASVEEMSASLNNVDRVIAEKRKISNHLLAVTISGGEKIEATNEHIAEVSKNIEAIADLMEMIKGVSSQTNLLAMNASIEAAHAGEFGKGFAVVADEIRKLAETTGESAKEVSSTLGTLVADIGVAFDSSRQSGEAFSSLNEEVRRFVEIFDEISGSTMELAAGSAEIMKAMTELLTQTGTIRTGSVKIEAETRAIERSLNAVSEASESSREDLQEIDTMTKLVNRGIGELSSLASASGADLEALRREIGAFKTDLA